MDLQQKESVFGLTLEELAEMIGCYPMVGFEYQKYWNLECKVGDLGKQNFFNCHPDYCEWLMFWESMKYEKVVSYDIIHNIAYISGNYPYDWEENELC